ncbi:MAG: hypothetical protein CL942_08245 [Desulfovibrio sp.]|nr:hypothetical protein [Desulfovibrio sp.]|tara:strand:- start:132 stop:383 length:252 start_codon:yes stop_codon:yes gene_type:complete
MLEKQSWENFREAGLLWWVNRILHLFGWALVCEVDEETKAVTSVYPARCRYRGFPEENESEGFKKVTDHLASNIKDLVADVSK